MKSQNASSRVLGGRRGITGTQYQRCCLPYTVVPDSCPFANMVHVMPTPASLSSYRLKAGSVEREKCCVLQNWGNGQSNHMGLISSEAFARTLAFLSGIILPPRTPLPMKSPQLLCPLFFFLYCFSFFFGQCLLNHLCGTKLCMAVHCHEMGRHKKKLGCSL